MEENAEAGDDVTLKLRNPAKSNNTNKQLIANVNIEDPFIPTIIAKFGNENILCLLDTGSSISLMSKEVFDKLKAQLKYKFLGRSVSISTINSQVKFTGCADISFKINKQHYRHNLYLSRIAETSPFDAILGYDFISKYNVLIFPEMGCCKLNNEFIYFNGSSKNQIRRSVKCSKII